MSEPSGPHDAAPLTPAELEHLLNAVEDRCNRAVAVINATARAVGGDQLRMYDDEDVQQMLGASLERIAGELRTLSDRALKARVAVTAEATRHPRAGS